MGDQARGELIGDDPLDGVCDADGVIDAAPTRDRGAPALGARCRVMVEPAVTSVPGWSLPRAEFLDCRA